MRPPKLYITFFLSFTFILIVTLLTIYGIYKVTEERERMNFFREQFRIYTSERVDLLRKLIEEKIRDKSKIDRTVFADIDLSLIEKYAKKNNAKVWITSNKSTLFKSFNGEIPNGIDNLSDEYRHPYDDISLYQDFNETREIYVVSPIKSPVLENITFHILFGERKIADQKTGFIFSLAVVGIIIAILVIPISRFITERVKQLKQSALRIASGDLSYRIDLKGNDEIGELGNAFNQMADKVERMIVGGKALTALVSHELRTPLTRIRIAEEILREKLENEKQDIYLRHLDDIREDIDLLNTLIGRILELSKIDMHEVRFEMEPFDIRQHINDLIHQLKPITDRKSLNVHIDLSPIPGFKGNISSLSTAFLNVLDNAVKYTAPDGHIFVTLSSRDGNVDMSVANSYKKLRDEDLVRIFEPFQRVGEPDKSGSGLGLAITQKIVERHGGTVLAANSQKGFEIRITLPLQGR